MNFSKIQKILKGFTVCPEKNHNSIIHDHGHSQGSNQPGKLWRFLFSKLLEGKAINAIAQKSRQYNADTKCQEKMNPRCSVE